MDTHTTPRQTRWGRSRFFGGGGIALVAVSVGIGAAAFAVFGLDIAPALLLSALFVLASADFAVRYLRISKAEG